MKNMIKNKLIKRMLIFIKLFYLKDNILKDNIFNIINNYEQRFLLIKFFNHNSKFYYKFYING